MSACGQSPPPSSRVGPGLPGLPFDLLREDSELRKGPIARSRFAPGLWPILIRAKGDQDLRGRVMWLRLRSSSERSIESASLGIARGLGSPRMWQAVVAALAVASLAVWM
jgi:hypothetical protein